MDLAKHGRLLKYWCGRACCCMGRRRRFMAYIGGKITTKKMQDIEHCPESKKSYKMKQGKLLQISISLMNWKSSGLQEYWYKMFKISYIITFWHHFGGEKTRGFWSFVYNLIRLILVCVQESLIQKSYNTSLVIQILSCVPAYSINIGQIDTPNTHIHDRSLQLKVAGLMQIDGRKPSPSSWNDAYFAILFGPIGFTASKTFNYLAF